MTPSLFNTLRLLAIGYVMYLCYTYGVNVTEKKYLRSVLEDTTQVVHAAEDAKDTTQQRLQGQEKAQDEYVHQTRDDQVRLAVAGNTVVRLQQRVKALQDELSHRSGDTAIAACRQTSQTLGELFSACAAEYRSLGQAAGEDRAAGTLCERSYDTLIKTDTRQTSEQQSSDSHVESLGTPPSEQAQAEHSEQP
jgi:chromosome segregation ATPase